MTGIHDLPPELLDLVIQEIVYRDGVGAVATHRLVCRAFNDAIRDFVFLRLPQEVFWNPVGRMVLVNNLDYFLLAKGKQLAEQGYRVDLQKKISQMMHFLIRKRVFEDISSESNTYLKILCAGLKTIIGTHTIARAILVNDPSLISLSPAWWAAFHTDGDLDVSVKIAILMIVGDHALVRNELKTLPDDWNAINLIYGDPLINAIKLGDMNMLNTIINHLTTRQILPKPKRRRGYSMANEPSSAFPLEDSISKAIIYNRADMAAALLHMYEVQFGAPESSVFDSWLRKSLVVGNSVIVKTLYTSHAQRPFRLSFSSLVEFLKAGDYNMVLEIFSPLTQSLQAPDAKKDPLNIAVRHRNLDAVRALLDTGKVDIDREVLHSHSAQFGNAMYAPHSYAGVRVAPLDVACCNEDHAMLEFLLNAGANYRRRFAVQLNGRCYYIIRKWAAHSRNGSHTHMPEYGYYYSMPPEEQLAFVFG